MSPIDPRHLPPLRLASGAVQGLLHVIGAVQTDLRRLSGASMSESRARVGCSSVRLDTGAIRRAMSDRARASEQSCAYPHHRTALERACAEPGRRSRRIRTSRLAPTCFRHSIQTLLLTDLARKGATQVGCSRTETLQSLLLVSPSACTSPAASIHRRENLLPPLCYRSSWSTSPAQILQDARE